MMRLMNEPSDKNPQEELLEDEEVTEVTKAESAEEDYKEKFVRLYAEFENYKKRSQKEKEQLAKYGMEKVLQEILVVHDHMERALTHSDPNEGGGEILEEGLQLIHKELLSLLNKFGCREIPTVGQPFDPQYHEALNKEYNPKYQPGTIIKEFQKGYVVGDRLLRPARVSVADEPPSL
jgi:molecular chaperone GrpE